MQRFIMVAILLVCAGCGAVSEEDLGQVKLELHDYSTVLQYFNDDNNQTYPWWTTFNSDPPSDWNGCERNMPPGTNQHYRCVNDWDTHPSYTPTQTGTNELVLDGNVTTTLVDEGFKLYGLDQMIASAQWNSIVAGSIWIEIIATMSKSGAGSFPCPFFESPVDGAIYPRLCPNQSAWQLYSTVLICNEHKPGCPPFVKQDLAGLRSVFFGTPDRLTPGQILGIGAVQYRIHYRAN